MGRRLRQVRGFFATSDDPYAGADMANAQRLGAVLWSLVVCLTLALLPLSPPTDALGPGGWLVAGALLVAGILLVRVLRHGGLAHWGAMLITCYEAAIAIGVMQWLSGGVGAPYDSLLLLPVLFVAATQPPRKIATFMVLVLAVLFAPHVYDRWDPQLAGADLAAFVIWCALAVVASLMMGGMRAQRLSLARGEAQAREEARLDILTGLHNRRAFDEALQREVEVSRRRKAPLSVGMVDIENFKAINDRWGHAEGDRCLREVALSLRKSLRQPDLCFRWGGDEFTIVFPATSESETAAIGDRLSQVIAEECARPDDEPMRVRFAAAELQKRMKADELVERVGIALTAAKAGAER
jgi:diguanylate cyclase (GGDEF)-like protein